MLSVAMMIPSLQRRAITAPPVTIGLERWPMGSSSGTLRGAVSECASGLCI